jgi:hypothetical protein
VVNVLTTYKFGLFRYVYLEWQRTSIKVFLISEFN